LLLLADALRASLELAALALLALQTRLVALLELVLLALKSLLLALLALALLVLNVLITLHLEKLTNCFALI
jgi:uncharacterized protein YoxC